MKDNFGSAWTGWLLAAAVLNSRAETGENCEECFDNNFTGKISCGASKVNQNLLKILKSTAIQEFGVQTQLQSGALP